MRFEVETESPDATLHFGRALGGLLEGGDVIGLAGELGAGKTQLVRGLATALDIAPHVIYSPSFTLIAEHDGRLRLNHIDLFRLGDSVSPADEAEIGLSDYLAPTGVTTVEWYRKLGDRVWTLEIEIEIRDGDRRTIRLEAESERGRKILEALRKSG
ncbi:MAG: tRNA (adenosine(37)-N6)-threonylcarbamoyltransferase complex ATPase subunit type 1 TsaE [Candidatus Binatia bacterium]